MTNRKHLCQSRQHPSCRPWSLPVLSPLQVTTSPRAALPPHWPQTLCAPQSLLQHFVINQECFGLILLFLTSLIDFLNYVSTKVFKKKKKRLTQQQLTAKLLKLSFHFTVLREPEIISILLKSSCILPLVKKAASSLRGTII